MRVEEYLTTERRAVANEAAERGGGRCCSLLEAVKMDPRGAAVLLPRERPGVVDHVGLADDRRTPRRRRPIAAGERARFVARPRRSGPDFHGRRRGSVLAYVDGVAQRAAREVAPVVRDRAAVEKTI